MSVPDIVSESSSKLPVEAMGSLSSGLESTSNTSATVSVASTVASVSSAVEEQIEIAQITANLRKKLVPLLPEFSLSTWINWAEAVDEFAQMVNDLNRIRKSHLEAQV